MYTNLFEVQFNETLQQFHIDIHSNFDALKYPEVNTIHVYSSFDQAHAVLAKLQDFRDKNAPITTSQLKRFHQQL